MSRVAAQLADQFSAAAAGAVAEHRLPGAAAGVVVDGELAWSEGFGFADQDRGLRPDADTLYRVASITKTFTATAIVQLRDRGALRLDDPLVAHLPELRAAGNPFGPIEEVTIRRALMHTSGLIGESPGMNLDTLRFPSAAEVLAEPERIAVAIPPETGHKYSNLGYSLLGEVVSRVGRRPYRRYVEEEILGPLELASTTFEPTGGLAARVARGYDGRHVSDRLRAARLLHAPDFEADGGLFSSVSDLARWIAFQLGADAHEDEPAEVLSPRSRAEMQRPRFLWENDWQEAHGLGFYSSRRADHTWTGHDGGLHGFITSFRFSAADGIGAIVLVNGIGPANDVALELCRLALDEQRPKLPSAPPAPVPGAYERLLGEYVDIELWEPIRIEWRDDRLVLVDGDDVWRLEETGDPLVFVVRGGRPSGEPAAFEERDGRVVAVNVAGYPLRRLSPS